MGNVTMPTPVALAGGALCLLGGYLVGVVAGPETESTDTATVSSYDADDDTLCLTGDAAAAEPESRDGELCGQWQRLSGSTAPEEGDEFRFTTLTNDPADDQGGDGAEGDSTVLIYGDVVR